MEPTASNPDNRLRTRVVAAAAIVALAAALSGCGDDDGESAQDRYCDAGESLRSSVSSLASLDLIAEGTNGLTSALETVDADVDELRAAASDTAEDEVEALDTAVGALGDAISGLAGEISAENATTLATAVQNVATSAEAVYATLTDC